MKTAGVEKVAKRLIQTKSVKYSGVVPELLVVEVKIISDENISMY